MGYLRGRLSIDPTNKKRKLTTSDDYQHVKFMIISGRKKRELTSFR
jgi:hypothetical protein